MTSASQSVVSLSLHKRFSKLLQFLPENLQHTQKMMNKMSLSAVNFIRKSWSKSFNNGIGYNRVGFKCTCTTTSRQNIELFYKLFTRATESGKSMGGSIFRKILPTNVPKCDGGKFYVFFDKQFSRWTKSYYLEPGLYLSITDFVGAMNTLIHERRNHSEKFCHS